VFTSKAFGPACMGGVLMVDFETGIYGFLFLLLGWTSMNDDSCAPARFENVGKLLMKIHGAASQGFIIMHAVSWTNIQKSHNENVLFALFVRCPCFSTSAEIEFIPSSILYRPAFLLRRSLDENLFPVFSISPLQRS
jgi:hypothetical protein